MLKVLQKIYKSSEQRPYPRFLRNISFCRFLQICLMKRLLKHDRHAVASTLEHPRGSFLRFLLQCMTFVLGYSLLCLMLHCCFSTGIELSGGLEYVSSFMFSTKKIIVKPGQRVWKSAKSVVWVLLKLSLPVAIFSAFLANIPLVAMMIPPIVEYAKKVRLFFLFDIIG